MPFSLDNRNGARLEVTAPATLPMAPYRPRRTQSLGVRSLAGWNVKIIGITSAGDLPGETELGAVLATIEDHLPQPARTPVRQGVAFVVVHQGTEALWVQLAWWELDILYQRVFRAEPGTTGLRRVPPGGPAACVWELLAIDHERRAWVAHVLERPDAPDLAGYLAETLTITAGTARPAARDRD